MHEIRRPAPWQRQPGETARAFYAFTLYRDMPPKERSLRRVAEALGYIRAMQGLRRPPVPGRIVAWSQRFAWVERAAAWDAEKERLAREAEAEAIKTMRERHAREAVALQERALQRLRDMRPEELSPRDVLAFLVEAARLERLSRGEPETVTEERNPWVEAVLRTWERRRQGEMRDAQRDA